MKISQTLEKRLEARYGATGSGLTQRIRSVEDRIPNHICQKIKQIAYVRNQAAHEDVSIAEKNLASAKENFDYAMNALNFAIFLKNVTAHRGTDFIRSSTASNQKCLLEFRARSIK